MMYRPIMNPIDRFDPRRRQPQPDMQPQMQPGRQQVAEALISPQQFAFAAGRNFEGMYPDPQQQPAQQPQMGRIMRPNRGLR